MADTTNTVGIKVVADTSGVTTEMRKIDQAAARTAGELEKVGRSGGFKKAGEDAAGASSKIEASQRNLIGSIQRTTAAMESGGRSTSKYYELLAQQRGVDGSALAPYLAQLRAVEVAQAKANASLGGGAPALDKIGLSAKQTAAALRGVPAQFTDIITSIQGGQAPLTVLLQQGGQLKDMFGGVGNASRALGGYILGLVNPYTVAAAAAVGLAVAYNQGSKEADAYNRALILTGNTAGATADQLSDVARAIGQVSGSQGDAAEAIAALAGTGKVSTANMREFATVTVEAQRVLGKSVKDTVSEFEALGKSPVEALGKINEKYNFITAAVYAQVKALEDQGRVIEAANVAQLAYAEGVAGQRQKVLDTLSDWERGWLRIKKAANGAFDSVIDVAFGREATKQQQITALLNTRETIENNIAIAKGRRDTLAERRLTAQLDANKAEINSIRAKEDAQKGAAAAEQRTAAATQLRNKWLGESDILLSKNEKRERDLAAARKQGVDLGLKEEEIQNRLAVIRKKYEETATRAPRARSDGAAEASLKKEAALLAQMAGLTSTFAGEWDDLNKLFAKGVITTDELTEAQAKLLAKQPAMKEAADSDAAAAKAMVKVQEEYAKLLDTAAATRDGFTSQAQAQKDENERIGMTREQIANLTATRLEELAVRKEADAQIAEGLDMSGRYAESLRAQAAALRDRAGAVRDGAAKQANVDMLGDWKRTVEKYEDVFRTGFADMLNNGKDGWKSFTKSLVTTFKTSVADQIYKMFAQPFVMRMVASLIGVTGGAGVANAADLVTGGAGGGSGVAGIISSAQAAYSAISTGFTGIATTVADTVQAAMYASGASPTLLTNGSFATGAGAAAGYLGGAAAGVYGGRALSNGYAISGSGNGLVNAGTAVGAFFGGPIGAAIGGLVAGAANRLFGMKAKEVTSTTLNGAFGADGFAGTTDAAFIQKGGIFRSDKTGVDKTAIDAATAKQFSAGYDAIKVASADFANVLGLNADSIKTRAQSLSIALTKDEEANKKAVEDFFIGVGNTIATELLPTLSDFAKEGEGASATLQRLATNYATIDAALTAIGLSFGTVGTDSLAARERLVTLSGGIEALAQNAAGFAQNFLTEADRLKPVAAMVAKSMADLGFSFVDTNAEFKELVLSLDLTEEAGAANYAALMKLQGAFAQVYPLIDTTAEAMKKQAEVLSERAGLQDQLDDLTMTSTQLLAKQRAALDASNRGLFDQISAIKAQAAALDAVKASASTLLGGVDDAFGVLQRVANAEKDRAAKAHEATMKRLQTSIDLETAAVAKRRALSDAIGSALGQQGTGLDRNGAQAQIQAAIAIAKASGVLPSADSLKDALSVLSRDSGDMFATLQDQQRDAAQTQNSLGELGKLADAALSVEERTLAALVSQKDAVQASYEAQIAKLDEMVSTEQAAIDELKGISTNGLTLIQAVEGVRLAILAAQGNAVSGSSAAITNAYKSALGRAPDAAGLQYFQGQAAAGTSVADIVSGINNSPEAKVQALYKEILGRGADAGGLDFFLKSGASPEAIRLALMQSDEYKKLKNIPGFGNGGFHSGGVRAVGELGVEIEATGASRIHSTRDLMAALRNPPDTNSGLTAAVEKLSKAVEKLEAVNASTSESSAQVADLLNNISGGGGPLLVEMA